MSDYNPETDNIDAYLTRHENKTLLRLLTAGSVDDGKSTLIGRLLHDTKMVYEDQLAALKRDTERHGTVKDGGFDFALLVDGLRAEREQGITIDVAYRFFSTEKRKFIIADTPGHEQYTRNMATGASTADLAILLVDARQGVMTQTRRHSFIASLLGIRHVVVAINKMDLVEYSQEIYDKIRTEYTDFAAKLMVRDIHFIPISALKGDNVVDRSSNMPWYNGAPLMDYLETVHIASDRNLIDFRFPVQYVLRPDLNFRGFCGTVASGIMRTGDEVLVMPSGRRSRIKKIVTYDGELKEAFPPEAVTVTLEDEVDISRGDMLVPPANVPHQARDIEAMLVWMGEEPMKEGNGYLLKHSTRYIPASVSQMRYRVNVNSLRREEDKQLNLNEIGRVALSLNRPIFFDEYNRNKATGNFILIDRMTNVTVAAGMILERKVGSGKREEKIVVREAKKSRVTADERGLRFNHKGVTLWLTGLPKAGKSTIAYALEKKLFDQGCAVHVLDGMIMRGGLSEGLGFSGADRSENLRRAAEVARISGRAGLITLAAFVSPCSEDRTIAREIIGSEQFIEVHLDAPLEVCEGRDDEGLYAKARSGEIKSLSGVSAPYEKPAAPDLTLPTHELSVDESVEKILALMRERGLV